MIPDLLSDQASSSVDHTLAHLARLDLLLRREVLRQRLLRPKPPDDEFRGLYISEDDVERLLTDPRAAASLLASTSLGHDGLATLDGAIAGLTARLRAEEDAERNAASGPPVVRLAHLFGLSEFERDVLIVCLAAELDLKYERLYAYLQDDVTKKRPTVDLLLRLLCPAIEDRLVARRSFASDAPLVRWNLITLNDDPGARRPVLLARYLKLDERIVDYLLGTGESDARLAPLLAAAEPEPALPPPDARAVLDHWGEAWEGTWHGAAPLVLFHGRYGTGKRAAASYLAAALGRPLLHLDASDLAASDLPPAQIFRLAEREARLTGAVLAWSHADGLLQPPPGSEAEQRAFVRALAAGRVPTILLAEKVWEPARDLADRPFLRLELRETTYAQRREHWRTGLSGQVADLPPGDVDALAGRFRLTSGQIADAIRRARALAWTRDPHNGHLSATDVDAACRAQAQHRLGTLARKLNPRYVWDDIVLPRPQLTTLRLVCATVRQRPVVYGAWGFDRKLSMGKGLIALFAGPSGTGKTMAAEVIATDLGLDLYKIDLATVVSKYIGETEKNLDRIFGEAQESDAILFFDEADALFGKRSEVKDAHDRYANIETAYLLQRTEEYDGLVILASNLKKNLDEAFVRRLHFLVEFPVPEEAERLEIWRRTFPAATPRMDDVDLPFLARKLKIAGGNIRNIILTAAFLAAEDREPVSMRHLVRAAGYELQKMGKLLVEADFEHYFVLARG